MTIHLCPPRDSGLMPCCNRAPFEVPQTDRMTLERANVTCRDLTPAHPDQAADVASGEGS